MGDERKDQNLPAKPTSSLMGQLVRQRQGEGIVPSQQQNTGLAGGQEGTNVGATLAALQGLGAERKLVAILGGEGKEQDFAPLAPAVFSHCRAVVLIGRDAPLIEAALAKCDVPMLAAGSLPAAVELAAGQARMGDAVLLSPACASFDMFRDYVHRAEVFRQAVADLAHKHGVTLEGGA